LLSVGQRRAGGAAGLIALNSPLGSPRRRRTWSLQDLKSSPANEWTTKPSGALGSKLTTRDLSRGECPGPGQMICPALTSPPSRWAAADKDAVSDWRNSLGRSISSLGVRNATSQSARAANTAMRFLRYLRRPAALKIESSEVFGSPSDFRRSPTRLHKTVLGKVAWSGIPSGYSSLMMRLARSRAGRLRSRTGLGGLPGSHGMAG
jgi:hypothetical protein